MTLNIGGKLLDFTTPMVMGILNVTTDSFYSASRMQDEDAIRQRAAQILSEGGEIVDVGAFSTRPGASVVSEEEEMRRLDQALAIIRKAYPDILISVDTFRASVAHRCVVEYGANIINDVSGGTLDTQMFETVADLHVPYVLTHSGGMADDKTEQSGTLVEDMCRFFAERLQTLHELGVADVILDPGFGFGKTLQQNYEVMHRLSDMIGLFPDNPSW